RKGKQVASISNMKIGRKIGVVLGGVVFLLAGLSALSLWGTRTNERLAADSLGRITTSRLAEAIAGDTAAIGQAVAQDVGNQILGKKPTEEQMNQIAELRKS